MQCSQKFIFNANFVETIFLKIAKAPIHIATSTRQVPKYEHTHIQLSNTLCLTNFLTFDNERRERTIEVSGSESIFT